MKRVLWVAYLYLITFVGIVILIRVCARYGLTETEVGFVLLTTAVIGGIGLVRADIRNSVK